MILKLSPSKNTVKNSLKGILTIALIGGSSLMCTQFIVASELGTITKVPNTYNTAELSYFANRQVPADYVKANYKTIYSANTLSKTPSSKELSMQEAAEIAAQEIFKFSGEKLDNKTVEMAYFPKTDQSSMWSADVDITPCYHFIVQIDACTGELLHFRCAGAPDIDKTFDIDAPSTNELIDKRLAAGIKQMNANLDASYAKVTNLITQKGYLSEPIQSIIYKYTYCDAFAVAAHTFQVTTASNKLYYFSVSQDFTQIRDFSWSRKNK